MVQVGGWFDAYWGHMICGWSLIKEIAGARAYNSTLIKSKHGELDEAVTSGGTKMEFNK